MTHRLWFLRDRSFQENFFGVYSPGLVHYVLNYDILNYIFFNSLKTCTELIDKNGNRQKIQHGWNSSEVMLGSFYCDGYAKVDERQIVFEYNGCAYHSCERCKAVRTDRDDTKKRNYIRSLPNTTLIEIFGCEWHAQKFEIPKSFKPEISPLLWTKKIHGGQLIELVKSEEIYGFMILDITKTKSAEKWLEVNWPPLFQKSEILYGDLPSWMQASYNSREFPMNTIVQKMSAKNLLLHTSLIKFYVENGFCVERIHKFYEYQGSRCFKKVFDTVYHARVQATEEKDEMKATAVKLVSNSMYGGLLTVSFKISQQFFVITFIFCHWWHFLSPKTVLAIGDSFCHWWQFFVTKDRFCHWWQFFVIGDSFCHKRQFLSPKTVFVIGDNFLSQKTLFVMGDSFCHQRQFCHWWQVFHRWNFCVTKTHFCHW